MPRFGSSLCTAIRTMKYHRTPALVPPHARCSTKNCVVPCAATVLDSVCVYHSIQGQYRTARTTVHEVSTGQRVAGA
eukprot:3143497-Rhodomonas_salina.1